MKNKFFLSLILFAILLGSIWMVSSSQARGKEKLLRHKRTGKPYWNRVKDFCYQLQKVDLKQLGQSKFDLVIMDYSRDGSEQGRYKGAEIRELQRSAGGEKLVLCYLSIGEAEDYRWYWKKEWDKDKDGKPDKGAPSWLGPSNPDWPGNYKVKFWDRRWQKLIASYLDKIAEMGFDGVYLDIIDAYEYWGPEGKSGLKRKKAEREMVNFVKSIGQYMRKKKKLPHFGVFPQNGEALGKHRDYLKAITGLGKEDTYFDGDSLQSAESVRWTLANLHYFRRSKKLLLLTDYPQKKKNIHEFYRRVRQFGGVPYATHRDLDRLTIHRGLEPK